MSTVLRTLAAVALAAALAGATVVFLGLYNVSARVGHLPGVSWVLHTTYRNAVRLRAPPRSAVPDLSDPALVRLGARHFDSACRSCHGAPGEIRTAAARSLVPQPPHIVDAVENWEPRHLHWIVYEGVKMSGMPHWPADRSDEVWSVVAFLEAARDMTPERYADLTRPPAGAGYCAGCHGQDGVGGLAPHVPRLDIQSEDYLVASLEAYRDATRSSGIMQHAATVADPDALAAAVRHYAALPPGSPPRSAGAGPVAEGAALAAAGTRSDDVPACRACHGPGATRSVAGTPSLSGQHREYLELQLHLWRDGDRGGSARADLMHAVARDLTDGDIAALAAYYASLPPRK